MPRGVRGSVDYDAQIQKLDERISMYSDRMAGLKAERQELVSKKQEAEMSGLYEFIKQNGITPTDAIKQLSSSVAAAQTVPDQLI